MPLPIAIPLIAGTISVITGRLVKSGIELFEQVLIQNGCFEYNEDGNYDINDDSLDALTNLNFKEFKEQKINQEMAEAQAKYEADIARRDTEKQTLNQQLADLQKSKEELGNTP
jgi:hypothetical protein